MIGMNCGYLYSIKGNVHRIILNTSRRKCSNLKTELKNINGRKYCLELVQKNEYENFLCTLLLSGHIRRYAFAVRAFNVEIAKIGSTVSEEHIGKIKLKFWFDSIDKCFDKNNISYVSDHPVLYELKYMAESKRLTKAYFKRLVTARERSPNQQFITAKDMEDYSEYSVSSIYYLLLEICGIKNMNVDHAASHLGKAQGITNLLRAIPYKRRSESLNIPQEILIRHGVSQERVMRGKIDDKGVEDCIFEVATMAHQHLEKSRNLCEHVPRNIRSLFLPAIAVARYLERLQKANFRLTDQHVLQRDSMLPVALYWVTARERSPNQQFITAKDMEDYSEYSVSSIYYLLLEICGIKNMNVDHAASHLGKAQGITNLLRAIPYKRRSESLNIPQEILIRHGVSQERVMRGKIDDKGVEDCIFEVATMAHQHLEKSRNLCEHVPRNIRSLFLPAIAVARYLERLQKANFRLTDQHVLQRDSMLPVALYWGHFRSNY